MQKQKIRTPIFVRVLFFSLISLGAIALLVIYELTEASSMTRYCERQFQLSFYQNISPRAKRMCSSEFQKIGDEWRTGLYKQF